MCLVFYSPDFTYLKNIKIRKIVEIILQKLKFPNVTTVSARFSFFFAHAKHKECPGVKEVH